MKPTVLCVAQSGFVANIVRHTVRGASTLAAMIMSGKGSSDYPEFTIVRLLWLANPREVLKYV